MAKIISVKIDGESIHVFNSALYIFESSLGYTLELDMIVSEVAVNKYKNLENLILEIELEGGRIISAIMHLKVFTGGLPQLNLFSELDAEDLDMYRELDRVNESDLNFPNVEEGITIEEIRKVEMPNKEIKLKLNLPIDQCEWLKKQKGSDLNQIFTQMIDEYWKKSAQ